MIDYKFYLWLKLKKENALGDFVCDALSLSISNLDNIKLKTYRISQNSFYYL